MPAGDPDWLPPAQWHATLPGVVLAASGLIGDGHGRIVVVKPNYRDHWTLPGGICEAGEPPHAGCAREVLEELGLSLPVGRLLALDWQPQHAAYGPDARPAMFFTFDCGVLPSLEGVTLQAEELDECRFAADGELDSLLLPAALPRVRAAMGSLAGDGCPVYVPGLSGSGR